MFSAEVRAFIVNVVRSLWALELLLLLHRHPSRLWSIEALTAELRASTSVVTDLLAAFDRAGLVGREADGAIAYRPATEDLSAIVDAIAAAYATTPIAVSREIFAASDDRIRSFADAFRVKKKDDPS